MGRKRKDISTLCRRDVRAVFLKSSSVYDVEEAESSGETAMDSRALNSGTVPPALEKPKK